MRRPLYSYPTLVSLCSRHRCQGGRKLAAAPGSGRAVWGAELTWLMIVMGGRAARSSLAAEPREGFPTIALRRSPVRSVGKGCVWSLPLLLDVAAPALRARPVRLPEHPISPAAGGSEGSVSGSATQGVFLNLHRSFQSSQVYQSSPCEGKSTRAVLRVVSADWPQPLEQLWLLSVSRTEFLPQILAAPFLSPALLAVPLSWRGRVTGDRESHAVQGAARSSPTPEGHGARKHKAGVKLMFTRARLQVQMHREHLKSFVGREMEKWKPCISGFSCTSSASSLLFSEDRGKITFTIPFFIVLVFKDYIQHPVTFPFIILIVVERL